MLRGAIHSESPLFMLAARLCLLPLNPKPYYHAET